MPQRLSKWDRQHRSPYSIQYCANERQQYSCFDPCNTFVWQIPAENSAACFEHKRLAQFGSIG